MLKFFIRQFRIAQLHWRQARAVRHVAQSRCVRVALMLNVVALAACGSSGQLISKSALQAAQIRNYNQVTVSDFSANDLRPVNDAQEKIQREKNVNEGRILFADKIAERITETRAFTTVSRKPLKGKFLVVSGTVDVWEPGNVAARALTGFVGQSQFASTILVRDGETDEELARINGDRNSWPLPIGASTTILQTVTFFMNEAANHIATELAQAKLVLARSAQESR